MVVVYVCGWVVRGEVTRGVWVCNDRLCLALHEKKKRIILVLAI